MRYKPLIMVLIFDLSRSDDSGIADVWVLLRYRQPAEKWNKNSGR